MKTWRCVSLSILAFVVFIATNGYTAESGGDTNALLHKTGIWGGLGLVLGATSPRISVELVKDSSLYVQVLQPEPKTALSWGQKTAASRFCEQLGIRQAAFNPEHYGSDLFNLIVVENTTALGKARMADLYRILIPNGVLAFKKAPRGFADDAKSLEMTPLVAGDFAASFRKPVKPAEWKPAVTQKWQAGPRSQIANGYAGIAAGDGKLFYMERMEMDEGNLNISVSRVFARDAYNGRTLWAWDAPGRWSRYSGIAVTSTGRVFVRTANRKVFCLDSATGKVLFQAVSQTGREARIGLINDDLLYLGGRIHSTETGKQLWRYPSYRYQPLGGKIIGENVYFCNGTTVYAKKLADGTPLWSKPVAELGLPYPYLRFLQVGKHLVIRQKGKKDEFHISLLDPADGKILWSHTSKVRIASSERYFHAGKVKLATVDDKLMIYYRHNRQSGGYADELVVTKLDLATGKEVIKDEVITPAGDFHGCFGELHLGDYIAWYDLCVNKKTLDTKLLHMPHPACFFGSRSKHGLVFNFPSRKSGPITATGPVDFKISDGPGGKVLKRLGKASSTEATKAGDWPMFRRTASGGNSTQASLGKNLTKAWEVSLGTGGTNFGVMSSQRTGLTQAVLAYGLAIVADIDGQRIVALDASNGKKKWAFHVGSRVDFSPTIYNGLCLFAARDGWVTCLDAKTGAPVWKLMVPAQERYVGGLDKLESMRPLASDVLIVDGIGYVLGGVKGGLAFKATTGEVVDSKYPDREMRVHHSTLLKGNSIPRTNEDNKHGFRRKKFGRRLDARVMAFDSALTVAYQFHPKGEGWANKGTLTLKAVETNPKKPLWTSPPIQLVVDDIVLTPERAYCVGHYQREKKAPELWVVNRADGTVLSTIPVDGFPAFFGMSAADNKLFVSTREGKLICFAGK